MRYRTKITLAFSGLTLLGVGLLSGMFLYTGYQELKLDRIATSRRMAGCLASNIAKDVRADALYRVFETLDWFAGGWRQAEQPQVVVSDAEGRIYATTLVPARDYLALPVSRLGEPYVTAMRTDARDGVYVLELDDAFLTLAPVVYEGHRLGLLMARFPLAGLRQHTYGLLRWVIGYSLALLGLLWLFGWALGKRMSGPLLNLTDNLRRVGRGDLDVSCAVTASGDEVGELARGFEEMLDGLRQKRALEEEIIRSERLAAIGQVAAGMAHEINNPLGGMLNAIKTYRRHGDDPAVAAKTLDLLDRGLSQLRSTVQVLLVNARLEERALTGQDLADIQTLVEPETRRKRIHLDWSVDIAPPSGVPASQARQVLMNLVLNAVQAVSEGGHIAVTCTRSEARLRLEVADDGPGIDPEQRRHLFEPFAHNARGHGLGLWVSYRIVSGLGGAIEAQDADPGTRFVVELPRRDCCGEQWRGK
jgi:two-component system NtrC family sensor kinase